MLETVGNAKKPLGIDRTCDSETEKAQNILLRRKKVIEKSLQAFVARKVLAMSLRNGL